MEFRQEYDRCRALVEARLEACFKGDGPQQELLDAMRYSLLAGGKRIRPVLALQFCAAVCGDVLPALDYACAVEMLHTYSLIHDDLPCMDDDDLRRGRPTCHKVYGECIAVLAGDALQAAAFQTAAEARGPAAGANTKAVSILACAAGAQSGICGGQYLDMAGEDRSLASSELTEIHDLKTGSLLAAACLMGLTASPVPASGAQIDAAARYAKALGLAFQVRDDVLDATSTTEVLGKPVGSDAANHKNTFVSLLGVDACQELVFKKTEEAKAAIGGRFSNTEFLCALADDLAGREN